MNSLPSGWHVESLAEVVGGGIFADGDWVESKDQDPTGTVRLTQLADVGVGVFRDRSDRWLREDQAARLGCTFLKGGDVLVARMPEPLGRACQVPGGIGRAVTVVDVAVMRPSRSDIDSRFLMWAINSPNIHDQICRMQSGTTRKRVSRKNLATVAVPIPGIAEQRRIVDLLEDHISRLDAAERALLGCLRKAEILEQLMLDRTREGETQLLGDVCEVHSGIQKQSKRIPADNPHPFLRVANVTARGLDLAEVHEIELFAGELERFALRKGDLLVVEGNGSPSQIGRAALWDGSIENCVHQNHLIRVRPGPEFDPEFLEMAWNSPRTRRELTNLSSSSSGLHTLSVGKLKSLRVPVPALARQAEIARQVRACRDSQRALDGSVSAGLARMRSLRRALLAAAFSGRLTGRTSDLDRAEETASA